MPWRVGRNMAFALPKPCSSSPSSLTSSGQTASAKTRSVGLKPNGRIDQGAAAEAAADQHMDVRAEPEVEQPGAAAAPHLAAIDLKLAAKLGQAARELSGQKLAAALDDADALSPRATSREAATPPP